MPIYSGFVYIWYDRKRKWFCIGSHFGTLSDNYTSSTGFMNRAFKKRPNDFKRKILDFYYGESHKELLLLEQKWLDMIKDDELCLGINKKNGTIRYYNVKKNASGLSGYAASELKKNFWESKAGAERKSIMSKEMKRNNPIKKGNIPWNKGKICPSISEGRKNNPVLLSKEQIKKKSDITKKLWEDPEYLEKMNNRKRPDPKKISFTMSGKNRSEATKSKISSSLSGKPKSEDHKKSLSISAKERSKVLLECPHCKYVGSGPAMNRWHFSNCKLRNI